MTKYEKTYLFLYEDKKKIVHSYAVFDLTKPRAMKKLREHLHVKRLPKGTVCHHKEILPPREVRKVHSPNTVIVS